MSVDTVYLSASSAAPAVACPDWCGVSFEEHLADLNNWEGRVLHTWHSVPLVQDPETKAGIERLELSAGVSTLVDGSLDPTDKDGFGVTFEGSYYTVAQIEAIVLELQQAIRIGRDWQRGHGQ